MTDVVAQPTQYTSRLICKRDSAGVLFLEVRLNPRQHSLEKLNLVYAGASQKHKLQQPGEGTGHYDAKTERYYFTTFYQTISELPGGLRYYSDQYPVHGWICAQTNTAAIQLVKL